jgi:plastocyanin domain-containing protein
MNGKAMVSALLLALGLGSSATGSAAPRRIDIAVSESGFSPDHLRVKAGESVTLAFTRKTDATCARKVVIELGQGAKVEKDLPLGETVLVQAAFAHGGPLRYACSMDMVKGVIAVE